MSQAFESAYAELRRLAHRQLRRLRPGQTLTTTSLVHEAFIKLVRNPVDTVDQAHFFALAARAMRQILVDYARQRGSLKRGADQRHLSLEDSALPVEALAEEMLGIDLNVAVSQSLAVRRCVMTETLSEMFAEIGQKPHRNQDDPPPRHGQRRLADPVQRAAPLA
jgi:RNA polymerase sigma factor (TIGR02999 family)